MAFSDLAQLELGQPSHRDSLAHELALAVLDYRKTLLYSTS
jgi:hypothetical protein